MSSSPVLAFYITAHGYGHAVRSCDVLHAVWKERPEAQVHIVSDLPESFLKSRLPAGRYSFRGRAFDVGVVQRGPLQIRIGETLDRIRSLYSRRSALVDTERAYLEQVGADVVVADIPAIPLQAASRNGLPGLAMGNFAWDWIYQAYTEYDAGWSSIVTQLQEDYSVCTRLMQLPLSEPMRIFPHRMEVPLVVRPGRVDRERIARVCGADPQHRWVLLSFSGLRLADEAVERMSRIPGVEFFTILPMRWQQPHFYAVDRHRISIADLCASVDVVMSKPGFGIVSDCMVNRKAMIYVSREDFRESSILESGIRRYLRHVRVPAAHLFQGAIESALAQIDRMPEPKEELPSDEGELCAKTILQFAEQGKQATG